MKRKYCPFYKYSKKTFREIIFIFGFSMSNKLKHSMVHETHILVLNISLLLKRSSRCWGRGGWKAFSICANRSRLTSFLPWPPILLLACPSTDTGICLWHHSLLPWKLMLSLTLTSGNKISLYLQCLEDISINLHMYDVPWETYQFPDYYSLGSISLIASWE